MSILAGFMVPHPPMIVPAVGRGGEEQIAETTKAYEQTAEEIAALKPDTIIISSPHIVMYSDYFHIPPAARARGSFAQFRAPQVRFEETCDTELIRRIGALAAEAKLPAGPLGEREKDLDHGTMVPLWFIEKKYRDKEYSASSLSKEIGVNTRCLSSVINLRYRDNFSQMVNDMRIREAQYMLSDRHFRDKNVEEIGAEVGYLTRQSFYTAFYKRTKMTPKEYRKQFYKE